MICAAYTPVHVYIASPQGYSKPLTSLIVCAGSSPGVSGCKTASKRQRPMYQSMPDSLKLRRPSSADAAIQGSECKSGHMFAGLSFADYAYTAVASTSGCCTYVWLVLCQVFVCCSNSLVIQRFCSQGLFCNQVWSLDWSKHAMQRIPNAPINDCFHCKCNHNMFSSCPICLTGKAKCSSRSYHL